MQSVHHRSSVAATTTAVAWLLAMAVSLPVQAGTLVSFNFTNFGTVQIDLFDDLVPTTVSNFVQNYVKTDGTPGLYNNTMVHRVDTGLGVIQGGGYLASNGASIATSAPIPLQYSRANTRGTIAMARAPDGGIAANTATATSQWFINTDNNSTSLAPAPASGNIPEQFGYAVFGWVVGGGMSVVDAIAAVPTIDYRGVPQQWADQWGLVNQGALAQWPLQNFTVTQANNGENPLPHDVVLASVTVVKTHPSYQNPLLATDVNNSGTVNATDAITVISDLIVNGQRTLTAPFAGTNYFDVDGNGKIGIADALITINAALAQSGAVQTSAMAAGPMAEGAVMAGEMTMPMIGVPEPSSLMLCALAALALAGCAAHRRKRRRASR